MFDAEFSTNPYPTYRRLLASGRLEWTDYLGGAWIVSRYNDIATLLRDPRLSAKRAAPYIMQFPEADRPRLRDIERHLSMWLVFKDADEHLTLRRLMNKAFTPRTIENLRPYIQQQTDMLIDQMIANAPSDGVVDLVQSFNHILPALVITHMLGVSAEHHADFMRWSEAIASFFTSGNATVDMALKAQAGSNAMLDYFRGVVTERRKQPGDDFVSLLISAEEQGALPNEEEVLVQCSLFLMAGHDTTRDLIGNGLMALLQNPDQRALLERDPALIKNALVEIARYESSSQTVTRIVAEDFEWCGTPLKRGQTLVFFLGAANRDPEQFADPDRFDITRPNNHLLSFGAGAHFCIGMALSYLEVEVALTTLLRRLPNLRLATETFQWLDSLAQRGVRSLPVHLGLDAPTEPFQ